MSVLGKMVQFFFGSLWTKSEPTGSDLEGKEERDE